jgi:sarcosine oxidase subunit alpha
VTATSSGAGVIYREMLRWVQVWGLKVTLSNATGQRAGMNLAGPNSRKALAKLTNIDLSPQAFPYMAIREGEVAGAKAIVMRVGFVGEMGYEVHVPAWYGAHVWESLYAAGEEFGIRPFGVEAQRLLRLEKGHIITSIDTDALTNPYEAQVDWALAMDKPFFIGQRSLQIISKQPGGGAKRKLVGIRWPAGYTGRLPEDCHLVIRDGRIAGRVTSIAGRSTVGYPVGMAYVEPDMAAPGTRIAIRLTDGVMCEAEVVKLPFYDPEAKRQAM